MRLNITVIAADEARSFIFLGQVKVEFNNANHTVNVGEEITVPSNDTHLVYTVSDTPSCWMYIYMNTTEWNNETIRNWILYPGMLNVFIQLK